MNPALEKIVFLWVNRRLVAGLGLLCYALSLVVILVTSPTYVATTTIFPKDGKVAAGGQSFLLGAVGLGGLQNSMVSRIEVLLNSEELAESSIVNDNLLPALFEDEWDSEKKVWVDGKPPRLRVAGKLVSRMMVLEPNTAGYIKVSVEAGSPALASRVLAAQLKALERRIRSDAELELRNNLEFLNLQLAENIDPLLRDKILGLKASYIESAVYSNAKAFDVSETPRPPLKPERPRKGLLAILALIGSFFVSCAAVLGVRAFREIRLAIQSP